MNIIVLVGGFSPEREVSLSTGGQVANALTRKGHKVLVVDSYKGIEQQGTFEELYLKYKEDDYSYNVPKVEPDLQDVKYKYGNGNVLLGKNVLEACREADIVFIGLHGSIGENGQLQAVFDVFDIKYTGNGYISSLLSMDKLISKELMVANGILTHSWVGVDLGSRGDDVWMPPIVEKGIRIGYCQNLSLCYLFNFMCCNYCVAVSINCYFTVIYINMPVLTFS